MAALRLLVLSVAVVVATAFASPALAAKGDCNPGGDWGATNESLAERVVELVNAHRAGLGMRPLKISPTLSRAATWKALHMARYGYMDHNDPGPPVARSVGDRIGACGYREGGWGENIAMGYTTPELVMRGWLNSPGHKANIETPGWTVIGVAAASRGGGAVYWAQVFGARDDSGHATRSPARGGAKVAPTSGSKLATSRVRTARKQPRVQRKLRVAIGVVDHANAQAITSGQVKCDATVAGKHLRVIVNAFQNGLAACAWRVPRWARGKQLVATIRVRSGNSLATRSFSRRL